MPFVPAKCPECGGNVVVDSEKDAWICDFCKTPFIVEKAVSNFNTFNNVTNNISAEVVNVYESKDKEFIVRGGILIEYNGSDDSIVIPNGVKEIGYRCFNEFRYITEVNIPEGVQHISNHAFAGCSRLKKITLPSTLKTIADDAFSDCKVIKEVIAPASLDGDIYKYVFPNVFNTSIHEKNVRKREKEYEIAKRIACRDEPMPCFFSSYYKPESLCHFKTNAFVFSINDETRLLYPELEQLVLFLQFGNDVIGQASMISLLERNKTLDKELDHYNDGSKWKFVGLYGHYFLFRSWHRGRGTEFQIGYCKECITNEQKLQQYMRNL